MCEHCDLVDGALRHVDPDAIGREIWAALGAAGLIRPVYDGEDPVRGVRPDRLGAVLSAVDARFSCGATLSICVQLATAIPILAGGRGPASEMLDEVLNEVLDGRAVLALAATDAESGGDLTAMETAIEIGRHAIVLSGGKRWVTNATAADHLLVLARHRPEKHFTSLTWVLVPATAPGVLTAPAESQLFHAASVGHVDLGAVHLSSTHVVGQVGRGLPAFARHIATERLAGALWAVAFCRRVLATTIDRLTQRRLGDGTLWTNPAVRQRVAVAIVRTRELAALAESLSADVAIRFDALAAATLKSAAGATVDEVLATCAHLHGADGFVDGGMQQLRAQGALFGIGGGATEVVLSIVAGGADRLLAELAAVPCGLAGSASGGGSDG